MSLLLLFQPAAAQPVQQIIVTQPIFLSQTDETVITLGTLDNTITLGQNDESVYLG